MEGEAVEVLGEEEEREGRCESLVERESGAGARAGSEPDEEEENESGRGSFEGDAFEAVGVVREGIGVGWTNSIVGVCGDAGGEGVRRRGGGLVGVAFESVCEERRAVAESSCDLVIASSSFKSLRTPQHPPQTSRGKEEEHTS